MKKIIRLVKDFIGIVDPKRHRFIFATSLPKFIKKCGEFIRKVKRYPFNPRIFKIVITAKVTLNSGIDVNKKWIVTLNPPLGLNREEELQWLEDNHETLIKRA